MIGRRMVLVATLGGGLIGWTACGASEIPSPGGPSSGSTAKKSKPKPKPKPKKTAVPADPGPAKDFPKPHPDFARHFTDPLYHDEGDEFAPFGSDEGSDVLHRWVDRRAELERCTTLREMVGADEASLEDLTKAHAPDLDGLLIGYGFTLLLLRGRIDSEGKKVVLAALRRTQTYYAKDSPRAPQVMERDLEAFPATDC